MQLSDIRSEVYLKGFDAGLFPATRLNQFINDGYLLTCQRCQFYTEEATQDFVTANGTIKYAWPTNFARLRLLHDTTRGIQIMPVSLRQMDNSGVPPTGPPQFYADDGTNFHLYPTPDGIYNLEARYWLLPTPLAQDADIPIIPAQWHHLLVRWTTAECYKAEDDFGTAAQWMADYEKYFAEFQAEVKFPDDGVPDVARSFWDVDRGLAAKGWSAVWGWY